MTARPGALALAYIEAKFSAQPIGGVNVGNVLADLKALLAAVDTLRKVAGMLEGARDEARADAKRLAEVTALLLEVAKPSASGGQVSPVFAEVPIREAEAALAAHRAGGGK